jgi:hypothetical protein
MAKHRIHSIEFKQRTVAITPNAPPGTVGRISRSCREPGLNRWVYDIVAEVPLLHGNDIVASCDQPLRRTGSAIAS